MARVYLFSQGERSGYLRGILEGEFEVVDYRPSGEGPGERDVLVLDLAGEHGELEGLLSGIRKSLPGEAGLLAVLRPEQLEDVGRRTEIDDFVLEGFTGEEIRVRVRRLMGAGRGSVEEGGLVIDEDRYQVRVDGFPVELTYKEFELLHFLASRPGKVFTREVLLEQVWGYDYFGGTRTVDVHIRRIRSKIEREGRTYIRTVRGVGYIFEPSGSNPS